MRPSVSLSLVLALFSGLLRGQTGAPALRGPDGGTRYHVSGIDVLPIPGHPFTAKDSIEWTRTLEDGTVTANHLEAAVARDSEGRLYRERRSFVPVNSGQQSMLMESIVSDPVAGTRTTCTVRQHQCVVTAYHAMTKAYTMPEGSFANGTRTLSRQVLGANVLDGLQVTGSLETITVNPGVLGNDRALSSTREFWYSPELENNIAVTRKDPREGTQKIQLIDLSRSEPEAVTFAVPAGYTVVDQRPVAQATLR